MKALVFAAALAGCADLAVSSYQQDSDLNLTGMVTNTIGLAAGWTLTNYGCYCGLGNPDDVIWLDPVDDCCRLHDEKYLAAPAQAAGCDCNKVDYDYSTAKGAVTCAAKQGVCATYCCQADKALVECVGKAGPFDPALVKIDRAKVCTPLECRGDDDCDPGTYCNGGTCRMYCDPGFATCAPEPIDETRAPL